MKHSEINILQSDSGVKVTTIRTIVCPIFIAGVVEFAFAAPGNQVIGIQTSDVCAHFVGPGGEESGCTVAGAGKVADGVAGAAGFVGEFPGHDSGRVLVPCDHGFDVAFECCLDLGIAVEL